MFLWGSATLHNRAFATLRKDECGLGRVANTQNVRHRPPIKEARVTNRVSIDRYVLGFVSTLNLHLSIVGVQSELVPETIK